jgi:hypothetical protein
MHLCINIDASRAADIHNVGQFSLLVSSRSLFSLLSAAVFRCYFAVASFKRPGFPRAREVSPLYFSSIISGISEHRHDRIERLRGCRWPIGGS